MLAQDVNLSIANDHSNDWDALVQASEHGFLYSNLPDWPDWYLERDLSDGRRIEIIKPTYEVIDKKFIVRPSRSEETHVPPVKKKVTRRVVKVPAKINEVAIPALTKQVTRRVVLEPAKFIEKEVDEKTESIWVLNPDTGIYEEDIIVVSPKFIDYEVIPPKYENVSETVIVRQAETRIERIPATFESKEEWVEVQPETIEYINIPAEFGSRAERIQTSPPRLVLLDKENFILHDFIYQDELEYFLENPNNESFVFRTLEFEIDSVSIDVTPETTEFVTIPATFETINEQVQVQLANTELVTIPAAFETVEEIIVVQEASKEFIPVEARFQNISETVITRPPSAEMPIQFKTLEKRVVTEPARIEERIIPAVTKTEQIRIITRPAGLVERVIPAIVRTETRRVVKELATTTERTVPAVTKEVSIKRVVEPLANDQIQYFRWDSVTDMELPEELSNIPQTSIRITVPYEFFETENFSQTSSEITLADVYSLLTQALQSNEEQRLNSEFFKYKDRGFAIRTESERIDGKTMEPLTISENGKKRKLKALERVKPKGPLDKLFGSEDELRFRRMLFIVAPKGNRSNTSGYLLNANDVGPEGALEAGVPISLLSRIPFSTQNYSCELRIYEFTMNDKYQITMDPFNVGDLESHKSGSEILQRILVK